MLISLLNLSFSCYHLYIRDSSDFIDKISELNGSPETFLLLTLDIKPTSHMRKDSVPSDNILCHVVMLFHLRSSWSRWLHMSWSIIISILIKIFFFRLVVQRWGRFLPQTMLICLLATSNIVVFDAQKNNNLVHVLLNGIGTLMIYFVFFWEIKMKLKSLYRSWCSYSGLLLINGSLQRLVMNLVLNVVYFVMSCLKRFLMEVIRPKRRC